jgi:hypothetical protein
MQIWNKLILKGTSFEGFSVCSWILWRLHNYLCSWQNIIFLWDFQSKDYMEKYVKYSVT